jgi:hypothetical protein
MEPLARDRHIVTSLEDMMRILANVAMFAL